MREIHLGQVVIQNRRKRGITQDELAKHLGVSTAAVSKWETESTYPDILMLPKIAAYFDISLDELMGYKPQMDSKEILSWYRKMSEEFANLPFSQALTHCHEAIKNYYSCYPFLFQAATLLLHYSTTAGSAENSKMIIEEALQIFQHVKNRTEDPTLGKEALQMEAYCLLILNRPAEVLQILGEKPSTEIPIEPLMASAHQMIGKTEEAKRVLQIGMYQQTLSLISLLSSYIQLCTDNPEHFEESCRRLKFISECFHLDELHPGILLSCYINMAQGWTILGKSEKALDCLKAYTDLAIRKIYPLRLHGDAYFYLLDNWFETMTLRTDPPRADSVIRQSITQALTNNPIFTVFSTDARFQAMTQQLRRHEEEK